MRLYPKEGQSAPIRRMIIRILRKLGFNIISPDRKLIENKSTNEITDHEFVNPCLCGCDGEEMPCSHYDENGEECLKPKAQHKSTNEEII